MKITDYTFEEKQNALDEANEIMKTDAERLSEIKAYINSARNDNYTPILRIDELDFVIGQAERVQKLEKEIEQTRWDMAELATSERKLREALEFYADVNNYFVVDMHTDSEVHKESGEQARQALDSSND